jgi:hypothetical protein
MAMQNKLLWVLLMAALLQGIFCYNFSDYVQQFGKNYSTPEEISYRKSNFDQNYSKILLFNSQGNGYTLRVNEMTDWSQAEVDGKAS